MLAYALDERNNFEVYGIDADVREVPLSATKFGPAAHEVLNLVAPETIQSLAPEYDRLRTDLRAQLGRVALTELREEGESYDLSVLSRTTGWDARLIGLAVLAARLGSDREVGLAESVLYGLFRVGLPTDKLLLARLDFEVVLGALERAEAAGIVALDERERRALKKRFGEFAKRVGLSITAPGSNSTYRELLRASGLNEDAQRAFASVYLGHKGDAKALWDEASKVLDSEQIRRLQLQGNAKSEGPVVA